MDAKEIIARRVAKEIKADMLVNLGIGLPSLVANYLPKDIHVFFQAENGVIGLGPRPPEGMEDPDLTDAGGGFVTAMPGAASIDSAMSFGIIRGGHLDMTVLSLSQSPKEGLHNRLGAMVVVAPGLLDFGPLWRPDGLGQARASGLSRAPHPRRPIRRRRTGSGSSGGRAGGSDRPRWRARKRDCTRVLCKSA